MKRIMAFVLALTLLCGVLTGCSGKSEISPDDYYDLLLELGYEENDIYDMKNVEDGLIRWTGLSNGRALYACVFDYTGSEQKSKQKETDAKDYFSESPYFFSEIDNGILFVAAADENHVEEFEQIVQAVGYQPHSQR